MGKRSEERKEERNRRAKRGGGDPPAATAEAGGLVTPYQGAPVNRSAVGLGTRERRFVFVSARSAGG